MVDPLHPRPNGASLKSAGGPADTGSRVLTGADRAAARELRERVRAEVSRLLGERELITPDPADEERNRGIIQGHVASYQRQALTRGERVLHDPGAVERFLFDGLLRLGILQPFIEDPEVEEILVDSPSRTYVIRQGRKVFAQDVIFESDEEVRSLVKRLIGALGRRLDESSPMVDVRLPDGSRLNAVIPPAANRYCTVSIRKFRLRASSLDQLVELGTLPESAARFLDAAVQGGVNILVSGPTGSGKTTLLNALGASIASAEERVITIEETSELQLDRFLPDCVGLQARAGNVEGAGEISIRDLVRNALRMRPSRIIVGEVRGAEALDMLLAMNTGHDGSLTTIHGSSPRDALDRLATLALMAPERISGEALNKMISRTIELVLQVRFEPRTGRRRLVNVFEVTGLEGDVVSGNDLWVLDPGTDRLTWTGIQPRCLAKIAARGVVYGLPPSSPDQEI